MRTDEDLEADLIERLDAIASIQASDIEILVENGMVTLRGEVDTQQTKFAVERTAKRVAGMRGIDIKLKPSGSAARRSHHH